MHDPTQDAPNEELLIEAPPKKVTLQERVQNIWNRARRLSSKQVWIALGITLAVTTVVFTCSRRAVYSEIPDLNKMSFGDLQKLAMSKLDTKISWVSFKDVPKEVRFAIIYSEDAAFFQHEGIDFDAISQSIQENIKRKKYAFGASTITQQVVKNVFLTKEKTLTRKFREMILAKRIEERFSKAQILEIYLNIVELGPKIYGLNAASRRYFGKFVNQLNAAEGSFFAILLPSPKKRFKSIYLKGEIPKVFRAQIRRILKDLEATQVITPEQHEEYSTYDYFFVRRQEPDWTGPTDAPLPDSEDSEDSHFSSDDEADSVETPKTEAPLADPLKEEFSNQKPNTDEETLEADE